MPHTHQILNLIAFQLGWWACVLSVRSDLEWAALLFAGALAGLQLIWSKKRLLELKLLLWVLPLGIALDSLAQLYWGWTFYGWSISYLSPFWLWMVWVLFTLTLRSSMAFLHNLPRAIQALMGFVMGPLSYIGGAQFGAASFETEPTKLLIMAFAWAVITPLLVQFSKDTEPSN
jgi:hypothetical protein